MIEDEEDAVLNDTSVYEFQRECCKKYVEGIWEHRGGDASLPFNGDRVAEFCSEMVDATNYARDDFTDGIITREEYEEVFAGCYKMWWWRRKRAGLL